MGDGWVTTAWLLFAPAVSWGPTAGAIWAIIFTLIVVAFFYLFHRNLKSWERLAGFDADEKVFDADEQVAGYDALDLDAHQKA
jgi:hypothetical protein